jgi:tetraacyldisaccharide 4'-kinase
VRIEAGRDGSLDGALQRLWRGERGLTSFLLGVVTSPLSVLFGTAVRTRNALFDIGLLRAARAGIPVISVGNLAVGGTGKTPFCAWLLRYLRRGGWKPALVVRGYGQDEVLLHRRWNPDIPVIQAPKRVEGVREAAAAQRDIVVLDDGFQHRWLRRDVDLVLLSPVQPLPVRLLPRGPFREPLRALRRADRVLVTAKGPSEQGPAAALARELRHAPGLPPVDLFRLAPGAWTTLEGEPAESPPGLPLAVCSVAQPRGFAEMVAGRVGAPVETLAFPDHHAYREKDAARISKRARGRWIATTEKDAVKLVSYRELLPEARVLPLVAVSDELLLEGLLADLGAPGAARPGKRGSP